MYFSICEVHIRTVQKKCQESRKSKTKGKINQSDKAVPHY